MLVFLFYSWTTPSPVFSVSAFSWDFKWKPMWAPQTFPVSSSYSSCLGKSTISSFICNLTSSRILSMRNILTTQSIHITNLDQLIIYCQYHLTTFTSSHFNTVFVFFGVFQVCSDSNDVSLFPHVQCGQHSHGDLEVYKYLYWDHLHPVYIYTGASGRGGWGLFPQWWLDVTLFLLINMKILNGSKVCPCQTRMICVRIIGDSSSYFLGTLLSFE